MTPIDPYHGQGGTFVVMPDGTRLPSDPETGEPIPPANPEQPKSGAPTPDQE